LSTLDTRPSTVDRQHVNTQPPTVDTRPFTVATRPSTVTTRPSTVATRPSTVATRLSTVATRLSTVATRPSTVDRQHSTVHVDCNVSTLDAPTDTSTDPFPFMVKSPVSSHPTVVPHRTYRARPLSRSGPRHSGQVPYVSLCRLTPFTPATQDDHASVSPSPPPFMGLFPYVPLSFLLS